MGVQFCMKNSALYEKLTWLPPVCTRNPYGCSILYEKFGFIREIHMASPVCTRNSSGGQVYMRNLLITDTRPFNASFSRSALCQGKKNIKQRSVELPAPFFRFEL